VAPTGRLIDPGPQVVSPPRLGGPGFALVEKVRDAIDRHRMVSEGETVLVAVSGGADSTCLLDVLERLSAVLQLHVVVGHVDHGLSPESEKVAARVSSAAATAGHEIHVVRAPDLTGPNLQARARSFRYEFFETVAQNIGANKIATGHTLDDRVETTLARLVHGAGTAGLAGIPPAEGMRIRPLITCRRAEVRDYCSERGLEFFDDPANEDERFERVAIRRRLVASIEDHWGPGAVEAIAAAADRLAEDSRALAEVSGRLFLELAERDEAGTRFDRASLGGLPRAVQRRLLELAVGRVRDRSGGIEAALDALKRDDSFEGRFAVASGIEIEIDAQRVFVANAPGPPSADP
jgi:tRNA(Ile)-lysidine synthase